MSFYRSLLAAVAAIAIASPVFADDTASTQGSNDSSMQLSENSSTTTTTSETTTSSSSDEQATKVNLNTASAKELMKVKGLNASKAKAIVAYRKKHGSFKSTAEIAKVKGFKKLSTDTLQSIQDQLTVE